jgi:DNA polymerase III epsilon subunit-like protein
MKEITNELNYRLLFLDTETTGNEEKDRICQLAYMIGGEKVNELYTPTVPISIDSMAVHHITPKMVVGKPAFKGSKEYKKLEELFADSKVVFIAHNAKFDAIMLRSEGLSVSKTIDTMKIARHLDPEGKIKSYRLQYLRYLLGIEVEAVAHDAFGDILVLEQLFYRLMKKVMEEGNVSQDSAVEQMIEISSKPLLLKYFTFGKHKNKSVLEVAKEDPGYLKWMLDQKQSSDQEEMEEDWIYTLKYHLNKSK